MTLPQEFEGYYDAEEYRKSQRYLKDSTAFGLVCDTVATAAKVLFIVLGGFNAVDHLARSLNFGPILTGVVFAAVLLLLSQLLGLPFSVYRTFVIEERYGFNRTTPATFALDLLKGWLLGLIIGGAAFAGVVAVFEHFGPGAWVYGWIGLSLFSLFLTFVAPVVIMPLFNKFVPLEDGELKRAVEAYAQRQNFRMKGLFKMDGSRRSTKSNAFFTGFGRYRRIVLFDTLIARHTTDELVSVLAHEMGHYKKKHILVSLVVSLATTGLMFFVLSIFINNPALFAAFRMDYLSVYASIVFFGFLYTPVSMLIGIGENVLARRHEYAADAYAVTTYGKPGAMIEALKKLSVHNLSNLTPHPLKVFIEYTHPPVLERVRAIREHDAGSVH